MTSPPSIVFLDRDTLDAGDIDFAPLEALGRVTCHARTSPPETAARVAGAEIVLTNKVMVDEAAIAASPGLRLVQVVATGINNVDLEAARARGVAVCNVSGYSTPSVAQHALALMLNLHSQVHRYAAEAALWPRSPVFTRLDHPIAELSGRLLGVAGLGEIGRSLARAAEALGMRVAGLAREGASPARGADGYERLPRNRFFAECDVISLHCPLTPDTRHLVNASTLALMKPDAVLINTGRGDLVDEAALAEALRARRIAGAGLDVLSSEPPPADHPLLDPSLPNLLVTPHTAWASRESRRRLLDGVASNLRAFLDGQRQNRVD